jgi:hypothetical protein
MQAARRGIRRTLGKFIAPHRRTIRPRAVRRLDLSIEKVDLLRAATKI